MRRLALVILLLFSLLLALMPVMASVDLVTPLDNYGTTASNISFEYYPSLPGVQECKLTVDSAEFLDTTITNEDFNVFTVVGVAEGVHTWHIECSNSTETESSVLRSFTIDTQGPTVTIISPANGTTTTQDTLSFIAEDALDDTLSCSVNLDTVYVATLEVANGTTGTMSLDLEEGARAVMVTCLDGLGNDGSATTFFTYEAPPDPLYLSLETNKQHYALGEQIRLTIDTMDGANLSLEVCPDESGFVQCYTHLVDDTYPQTITLPYTNTSGDFIIEGVATLGNETVLETTTYTVEDTMTVRITSADEPELNGEITYTAAVTGAIGDITYAWELSDGSTPTTKNAKRTYTKIGTFTEKVRVEDEAGNVRNATYKAIVDPYFALTVTVQDEATGKPIENATVQIEASDSSGQADTLTTDEKGIVRFALEEETYKLFTSALWYGYAVEEVEMKKDKAVTVKLTPNDSEKPKVSFIEPTDGATSGLPLAVAFKVTDATQTTCTFSHKKAGGEWRDQSGTVSVGPGKQGSFSVTALEEGEHTLRISCLDTSDNLGVSEERSVTIEQANEQDATDSLGFGDDPLEVIDLAFGFYDAFTSEQKKIADLLGWEQTINQRKKELQRLARDYDGISFRRDLNAAEKDAERAKIKESIDAVTAKVPVDLQLIDKKTTVEYMKADELATYATEIIRLKGYAMDAEQLVSFLMEVQQAFAKETTVAKAVLVNGDNTEHPIGIVSHQIRYELKHDAGGTASSIDDPAGVAFGDALDGTYSLYEIIPESVAQLETEVLTGDEHEVLQERPLRVEFPPLNTLSYYVEGDVSLAELGEIETVLLRKPTAEDLRPATGNAILGGVAIDWKLSLILSLLLAIAIIVVRRFDAIRHLKFLFYAESRKKPLHAIRTIINDGIAHLEGGDIDRAVMRYKEAKLSYEHLSTYAQNEIFTDLIAFKNALDTGYFTMLADRIKESILAGRLEEAIDDFARLEGTFDELAPTEQEALVSLVLELGERLGLTQHVGGGTA